jgi:hypothetical protein
MEVLVIVGNINTILWCGPLIVNHSALNLVVFIDFPTMHNVIPHFLRVKHPDLTDQENFHIQKMQKGPERATWGRQGFHGFEVRAARD